MGTKTVQVSSSIRLDSRSKIWKADITLGPLRLGFGFAGVGFGPGTTLGNGVPESRQVRIFLTRFSAATRPLNLDGMGGCSSELDRNTSRFFLKYSAIQLLDLVGGMRWAW